MEIIIKIEDFENGIFLERSTSSFEVAEMNLGSLQDAYIKELEKVKKELTEKTDSEDLIL